MTEHALRSGLFSRLLAVCVAAALICAAVATIVFYSYRDAIIQNRLVAEIGVQANALAPLTVQTIAQNDVAATSAIL
ncbi:MAG: hypothetical protein ACON4I_06365 [Candidatus Puniceispirillaceae bacterium]